MWEVNFLFFEHFHEQNVFSQLESLSKLDNEYKFQTILYHSEPFKEHNLSHGKNQGVRSRTNYMRKWNKSDKMEHETYLYLDDLASSLF